MNDLVLEISEVSKIYNKSVTALDNFSLTIKPGILGLLGPNGAGKSTLMRMIATISKPTTGKILWNGIDIAKRPDELRKVLGYLPQDFGVYPNLNAVEFLEYMAALKGVPRKAAKIRITELLESLNLIHARKRPLKDYSGGMKQRIGIAQALLNDPKLLIVDEPTVGLDPEERVRFRNLIADIASDRIVILSTHIVSDVEASASKIAILNQGRLVTHKEPEELLNEIDGKVWNTLIHSSELVKARNTYLISRTMRQKDGVMLRVISSDSPSNLATQITPNLEEAYLYYIKNHN